MICPGKDSSKSGVYCLRLGVWCAIMASATTLFSQQDAASSSPTEAASRQYASAAALQNRGVFDLAAQEWTKFIKTYGSDARVDRAFYYLGFCYYKTKNFEAARQCFETVINIYPQCELRESACFYLGLTQWEEGRKGKSNAYTAAAATLNKLLGADPHGKYAAQATFYRGEALYALGEKKEAAAAYARFSENFPSDPLLPDALYALGVTQEDLGQNAEAGKTFNQFLQKFADHPLAVEVGMRRGDTLFAQGDFAAAVPCFAAAAAAEGFSLADLALMRQAAALAHLKRYSEAGALYASLPAKFPQSKQKTAAQLAGGKCFYLAGDYPRAEKLFRAAQGGGGATAPEAAHWAARSLLQQKKPEEAFGVVEAILSRTADGPAKAQLLMDQADALYDIPSRRGQSEALYAALAEKYPQDPNAPQALYLAAYVALSQGDYPAAIRHAAAFQKAFPNHPQTPDVLFVEAESRRLSGGLDAAEKLFAQLLRQFPTHPDAETWKIRRGWTLFQQKKYADTVRTLQAVLADLKKPESVAEALSLIGGSLAELKQYDGAAAAYRQLLEKQPQCPQAPAALYGLAWALKRQHKDQEAADTFQRLAEQYPQCPFAAESRYQAGELAYASGDYPKAIAAYQAAAEKAGQSGWSEKAAYKLGWVFFKSGDFARAEQAFARQKSTWPDGPLASEAAFLEAESLFQQKKYAEALAAYAAIKKFSSPDFAALARLHAAQAAGQLRQWGKSSELLTAAARNFSQSEYLPEILCELGWAKQNAGQPAEALKLYEQVIARTNREAAARAQFLIGEIQLQEKKYADAIKSYTKVIYGYGYPSWSAEAAYQSARCFETLQKPAQAIKQYEELIEKFPHSEKTPAAKKRLEELKK